jgi:hypothetical protein
VRPAVLRFLGVGKENNPTRISVGERAQNDRLNHAENRSLRSDPTARVKTAIARNAGDLANERKP